MLARVRGRLAGFVPAGEFDRKLLAPLMLGSLLNPVNSSIIAVALLPIGVAFGAPPAATAWLVSALYLATAIGQPVTGRLIDTYGPRRVFLAATSLVGIAGVVGALAPNLPVLVVARVILGFGTCAGYPAAMWVIRSEATRTGRAGHAGVLTLLSITSQTITVIGPPLGGLLIGLGGWRTTLALNVPLSVAALLLGALRLPRTPPPERGSGTRGVASLDFPGMGLFAATLVALLLFLMHPASGRWYLPVLAVVAAAGFAIRELRATAPFLDLRVLAGNVPLLATYARQLLAGIGAYALLYGYTQWLEDGHDLSASAAGLVLLPMSLVAIVLSATTGRLRQLRGRLLAGAGAQAVAGVLLLVTGPDSGMWLLVLIVLIGGIPRGLSNLANQTALYRQADPDRIGASAGLLRTVFYLGAIVAGAAQGNFLSAANPTDGLHHLALFMLVIAALLLALTALDRPLHRLGSRQEPATDAPAGGGVSNPQREPERKETHR
ncbi:MAG: MFS transporter [Nocardioidaceae bacterium]